MANLWLESNLDLEPGCCPGKVYALLFNRSHQALKPNGSGVYVMTSYVKADHHDFAIALNEHPERTSYYYREVDEADFVLAASQRGSPYRLEIWVQEGTGDYDRDADTFLGVVDLVWDQEAVVLSELGIRGVDELAGYVAHLCVAYDSEDHTLRIMSHLDRNGSLVTDPQELTVEMVDAAGTVIYSAVKTTFIPGRSGEYAWDVPEFDLEPDTIYSVKAIIKDADGNDHETVSYVNVWD